MVQILGVITDPTGRPVPRAIIELRALSTTGEVLMGSAMTFKCDEAGGYSFQLAVGTYDVYAQNDVCGDMDYMGTGVVTAKSKDGPLNDILVDGGINLTPPLLDRAVEAMQRSEAAAEATAEDRQQTGRDVVATEQARATATAQAAAASASATTAGSKAASASASAYAAAGSEDNAKKWAGNPVGAEVAPGQYSALHHATKAGMAASASADSEEAAAASAKTAASKAGEVEVNASAVLQAEAAVQEMQGVVIEKADQAQAAASVASSKADLAAQAQASANTSALRASEAKMMAEAWAQNPEGSDVNGRPGEFSALHWALKAQRWAQAITAQLVWAGPWNAAAGAPAAPDDGQGVPFYRISHPGVIDGVSYVAGDYLHWDPATRSWFRIDGSDAVISVNGMTGAVVLGAADVGARPASWVPKVADVTGLEQVLATKLDANAYKARYHMLNNNGTGFTFITNKDMNTCVAGDFGLFEKATCPNSPPSANPYFYCETKLIYSAAALLQVAWPYDGGGVMAVRNYSLNTKSWSLWREVFDTGNKPTIQHVEGLQSALNALAPASHAHPGSWLNPITLSSEDLDALVSPGVYAQSANANTSAARHYPENNAGSLTVTIGAGCQQVYHVYNTSRRYSRAKYGTGAWTPWAREYNTLNKPTAADIGVGVAIWTGSVAVNAGYTIPKVAGIYAVTVKTTDGATAYSTTLYWDGATTTWAAYLASGGAIQVCISSAGKVYSPASSSYNLTAIHKIA